ncbi:hypothetical protein AMTRI_Chr07g23470 [Amborella trichopoda]
MGNNGSRRRRHSHHHHSQTPNSSAPTISTQEPPQQQQPDQQQRQRQQQQQQQHVNPYVFAAATPYPPPQFPNPNPNNHQFYQYPNYYPPPPPLSVPLPSPYDQHHHHHNHDSPHANWGYGVRPLNMPHGPTSCVEHQRAITIRNDVNLKKETLKIEPDEEHPGSYLVAFTFDATVSGRITIYFFAKEGADCSLTSLKENLLHPVTVSFEQGLGQTFRQPSGTGIDFSLLSEAELTKDGENEVFPLAVKADALPPGVNGPPNEEKAQDTTPGAVNSQTTQAVFEKKENGDYQVRVVKQILWVSGMRYELQEIYGIGNSMENDYDGNDPGKECVICLSEPRDTTVLPCRHMCMCSGCAKVLRFQTSRCPICRQPVERLLEIKVTKPDEE